MHFRLKEIDLGLNVNTDDCTLGQHVNVTALHFCVDLNSLSKVKIEKAVSVDLITVHFTVNLNSLVNVKIENLT